MLNVVLWIVDGAGSLALLGAVSALILDLLTSHKPSPVEPRPDPTYQLAREYRLWLVDDDGTLNTWGELEIEKEDPALAVHRQMHERRLAAQPEVGGTWQEVIAYDRMQVRRAWNLEHDETEVLYETLFGPLHTRRLTREETRAAAEAYVRRRREE